MDSDVLTSLPMDDIAQLGFDLGGGDSLLSECMPQLGSFFNTNGCMSYEPNMTLAINEAGTTLAEMLQTESILLAAESHSRYHTESSSSSASALQQLLTTDSITVPILGNSSSIVANSRTKQNVNPSQAASHGSSELTQILLQKGTAIKALRPASSLPSITDSVSLAQIFQAPSESQARVADAISKFAALPEEMCDSRFSCEGTEGSSELVNSLSLEDSANLDIGTFPLFSGDENCAFFENGITATDVSSLLEQFEEAANNLAMPEDIMETAPTPSQPEVSSLEPVVTPSQPVVSSVEPSDPVSQPAATSPVNKSMESQLGLKVEASPDPSVTSLPETSPISVQVVLEQTSATTPEKSPPPTGPYLPGQPVSCLQRRPLQKIEPQPQRRSFVDPESEVVKLLKAKRRVVSPQKSVNPAQPTPPPTPPPEVIERIKASNNKRKAAIMLADSVPAKGDRGGKAVSLPEFTSKKVRKNDLGPQDLRGMLKKIESQQGRLELSPFKLEEALISLSNSEQTSTSSSSGEASRGSSPVPGGTTHKKKLTLSQYKQQLQSRDCSRESSPTRSLSPCLKISTSTQSLQSLSLLVEEQSKNTKLSPTYYRLIADHDYCQNVPVAEELRLKENTASQSSDREFKDITDMEVVQVGDENAVDNPKSEEDLLNEAKMKKRDSVLKSLLLNTNLADELKEQAQQDRVSTMRNMNGEQPGTKDSLAVVDMDMDYEDEEETVNEGSISKFITDSERKDLNSNKVKKDSVHKDSVHKPPVARGDRSLRQYRRRSPSPVQNHQRAGFDKLPSYFTDLAIPNKPGVVKAKGSAAKMSDTGIPYKDRDPSPDRSDPTFSKLPAYHSCFVNSTRYDQGPSRKDPLGLETEENYPSHPHSRVTSTHSSRSQTPNLVIASRINSRATSQAASPQTHSPSRSRSPSYSRGSERRGRSRRRRRKRSWRRSRHRSYSSASSADSRSRSRSRSRLRSRSRGRRSYSSTSRSRSRSWSRSSSLSSSSASGRQRGQHRSRSGSCSWSRSSSWTRWQEEQKVKREEEKKQTIEERRIIYVGRIPSTYKRSDLRRTFQRFGDIEEVSVHFREHGDNYGFVTFAFTCDAYAAIEKGRQIPGCEGYDLCFGGRREFCKSDYADLDGNMEDDEEMAPVVSQSNGAMDFDEMLRQATLKLKKKH